MAQAAASSGLLHNLISSSSNTTIHATDDQILAVLQSRFRSDLPFSRVGDTHYVLVNPYKTLANVNEVSAREYEERCFRSLDQAEGAETMQPHVYEMAARVYLLMRRKNENQVVLARGISSSGKSSSLSLLQSQLLRLSTTKESKISTQIKSFATILDSFGNAKTLLNPNASRHSRLVELHFSQDKGRIAGAKILTWGLDKSRLNRLSTEERSFHVFYQFLAGATGTERDLLNIEDASEYALLSSSGTYRLPGGPFSDDSIAMGDLRGAMRTLGFKQKTMASIFQLLITILVLSNIQFFDGDANSVSASIANPAVLEQAARLLGVAAEDLEGALTNKTAYVRKELYTVILSAKQATAQRDSLMRDLYAILFAFVVETVNNKIAPKSSSTNIITLFDIPGYTTRTPQQTGSISSLSGTLLNSPYGSNTFDDFVINFSDELFHSYILSEIFSDDNPMHEDGVPLVDVGILDNSACIELLRGSGPGSDGRKPGGLIGVMAKASGNYKSGKSEADDEGEQLLASLNEFSVHASFATSRGQFAVTHYTTPTSYSPAHFVSRNADVLDSAFVNLLRTSEDGFVKKLFSGPSLNCERHSKDEGVVVLAQVSSRPLRTPTGHEEEAVLDENKTWPLTTQLNATLSSLLRSLKSQAGAEWVISCIRPNDSGSSNSFDKRRVKSQIRSLVLSPLLSRISATPFLTSLPHETFCDRYVPRMQGSTSERITQCVRAHGWVQGKDYQLGKANVWLAYDAWKGVEDVLRQGERDARKAMGEEDDETRSFVDDTHTQEDGGALSAPSYQYGYNGSNDNLLSSRAPPPISTDSHGYAAGGLHTPSREFPEAAEEPDVGGPWSEWDRKESNYSPTPDASKAKLVVKEANNAVEEVPTSRIRRWWLWIVWMNTFFIPSFLLNSLGRMKRPDVRLAWREKYTIFFLIFLFNGIVIFYIVEFGRLLCPNFDKAWSLQDLQAHTTDDDWWVAIQGVVYDMSNFAVHGDHSDIQGQKSNTPDVLEGLAGTDMTNYFPVPLSFGCQGLVNDQSLAIRPKNFSEDFPSAMHISGNLQPVTSTKLRQNDWYNTTFLPTVKQFRKGPLVWDMGLIKSLANDQDNQKTWAVYQGDVFDLTDYLNTIDTYSTNTAYQFLNDSIVNMFKQRAGQDITKELGDVYAKMDPQTRDMNINCLKNNFFVGQTDFRKTPRCQVQNYILITVSAILMASMGLKFLAALQLGPKNNPELQDKFVLCQVPCYTEGEDSLRRTIDSLAALNYDDKRKLIFIICDGNIIGSGNDRTTPRIVLDILGIDPKLDPEPLLFKSVGEGSRALNYGKVYSGLYEFEGHVVPYMVVVKVGKPTERSKPGNRGKRDSQILLMHYLNRVHFDAPMSPLELEIYHQMRNVIGIDPAFYEYIFTVDADTTVTPDSLNRLVASSSDDSAIIGICGETKLHNEEGSWWTMIQVYEYYLSHHLSKAFESLFGSVTCLPGCFSLYRIRTSDKGRPIIISNRVIDEYAEPNIDTLHKKNLFSLGEDRFLTTLLMKHFPTFKTKFCGDAIAHTVAPESWRILFSQRRRWINSTVHNLCELVLLPELFGFCCFSMRFFVFIDLLGTLILPSTVVYIVYLIITVVTGNGPFPLISIIMIAVVYGLQAIIFILKREFMLIGWMVVYIASYPVYSFFLPIYSFWCMDEFSWGNTRLVIGEGKEKKVITNEDEKFDESMIPLKKFSEYEAEAWDGASRHTDDTGYKTHSPRSASRAPRSREESPHTYQQASQTGDYYRDTNAMYSQGRLGSQVSLSNLSHHAPSQYAAPQLPFMPFGGGPGSIAGSDYGGPTMPMGMMPTGSMYGMPMGAPRNTMMSNFGMFGQNTGGSFGGSQSGHGPLPPPGMLGHSRPMSTFSVGTSVNAFSAPSMNPNPTDDELFTALRNYLSTQDLMTVTKKTAREAIAARFPKADLSSRKDFLNKSIDNILSES